MTLAAQITLHRNLYRDELDFNPTQRTPPVAYTWDEAQRIMVPDDRPLVINPMTADEILVPDSATQSTQVGMPMSGRMLRYLQGPGPDTPWAIALRGLRAECRRNHPYHRGPAVPYWRGSLCWQLVYMTVIGKPKGNGPATIEEAAAILRYDNPEPVLREALQWIEDAMDRARQKAERRQRDEQGRGPGAVPEYVPVHHAVPGLHQADCPQCRRNAA